MHVTLPDRLECLKKEAWVPEDAPRYRISPTKDGAYLFTKKGLAVAQIIKSRGKTSLTLADRGALIIAKTRAGLEFGPLKLEKGEPAPAKSKERGYGKDVFLFGNHAENQYKIYYRVEGEVYPRLMFRVVRHPLNDRLANMEIEDGENPLFCVALALAISTLR